MTPLATRDAAPSAGIPGRESEQVAQHLYASPRPLLATRSASGWIRCRLPCYRCGHAMLLRAGHAVKNTRGSAAGYVYCCICTCTEAGNSRCSLRGSVVGARPRRQDDSRAIHHTLVSVDVLPPSKLHIINTTLSPVSRSLSQPGSGALPR
jgi:hypothetical protein